MLPEYPKFKAITINDLKDIKHYLKKEQAGICEFSFANLVIWQEFDRPQVTLINKNLCILITPANEPPFFLEPIGNHKIKETTDICLQHTGKISRATEIFLKRIPLEQYKASCLRNHFDYIYETKALAELKGKKYDGKRNHLKKFKRRYPEYKYLPLKKSDQKAALELFEHWFAARERSRYFPKLAYKSQHQAVTNAFNHFDELGFLGGAIMIDNQLKGFIMGSPLNDSTISVHFQYGDPKIQGIFQMLLWEACNKSFASFKLVNLEQDLGIPGLRKAKLSYYPIKLEKKFEISLK